MLLRATNLSHSFDTLLYKNITLTLDRCESIAILGVSLHDVTAKSRANLTF